MKRLIRLLMVGAVGLAMFTAWALESSGVANVVTQTREGSERTTHVWYVESDGDVWLETGKPENRWFVDLQNERTLDFSGAGRSGKFIAKPVTDARVRTKIRSLLREKYGIRDRWIGVLFDTSRSIPVHLIPIDDEL